MRHRRWMSDDAWLLCSFQGPQGGRPAGFAGRSLKTQQHAPAKDARNARLAGPGSVDVLGRTVGGPTLELVASSSRMTSEANSRRRRRAVRAPVSGLPRKEVIQPHLPVRLPCYDFTPVTSPTFDGSLPQGVRPPASGVAHSRGVTGGVYKARERIHRSNADLRLLATPTSRSRVADCDPN